MASFTDLVAAIANAESRAVLARLAEEQAALRRVATLVARGAAAGELFAAVAGEVGPLLGAHLAGMGRYDSDDTVTVLAARAAESEQHPLVPGSWPLEGGDLASIVFSTGQSVRIDDYQGVPGRIAEFVRDELGIGSSVASPIVAEGRLWGVLYLQAKQIHQPFPSDAESRLTGFTELLATAVANAESRAELLASRARIVAAADEARRRIERDLHDGTQQQLVSLILQLSAVQAAVPPRRAPVPVPVDLHAGRRLPGPVEVAAYYAVSEAVANAAKHARASAVQVELGGTLHITSPPGGGTLPIQIPAARTTPPGP